MLDIKDILSQFSIYLFYVYSLLSVDIVVSLYKRQQVIT